MPPDASAGVVTHVSGQSRVVNTGYGIRPWGVGDPDHAAQLEGGLPQGAGSSPSIYGFVGTPAHHYATDGCKGYMLGEATVADAAALGDATADVDAYADDNSASCGRTVASLAEARAVMVEADEMAERLAIGLMVAGIRMQQPKCNVACSPEMARYIPTPNVKIVALTGEGQLRRLPLTIVNTPGDKTGTSPESRGT
eukprot:6894606-Prymnesium_polylepis.1